MQLLGETLVLCSKLCLFCAFCFYLKTRRKWLWSNLASRNIVCWALYWVISVTQKACTVRDTLKELCWNNWVEHHGNGRDKWHTGQQTVSCWIIFCKDFWHNCFHIFHLWKTDLVVISLASWFNSTLRNAGLASCLCKNGLYIRVYQMHC